jgi:pimeloyl-ACP methyl ester carboxylesterase
MNHTLELGAGRSLFMRRWGKGPAVVLIHGALVTHSDWPIDLLTWLAERATVHVLDRPSHGESERLRFAAAPPLQARQIYEGLVKLNVGPALVVAHSFGGLVALSLAEQFPSAVSGLVLVSPMCFPDVRPMEHTLFAPRSAPLVGPLISSAYAATVDPLILRAAQILMFSPQRPPSAWLRAYPYASVLTPSHMLEEGEDAATIASISALVNFSQIAAPAEILVGSRDIVCRPERHGVRAARLLPHAALTRLEGVGHMVHHVAGKAVQRSISHFIE